MNILDDIYDPFDVLFGFEDKWFRSFRDVFTDLDLLAEKPKELEKKEEVPQKVEKMEEEKEEKEDKKEEEINTNIEEPKEEEINTNMEEEKEEPKEEEKEEEIRLRRWSKVATPSLLL